MLTWCCLSRYSTDDGNGEDDHPHCNVVRGKFGKLMSYLLIFAGYIYV